jgi:hypothetical protein
LNSEKYHSLFREYMMIKIGLVEREERREKSKEKREEKREK